MEIINSLKNFETLKSSTLTIGSYDGIHRGHHRILQSVIDFSKSQNNNSVLITFNPHPKHIIGLEKDSKVQLIMSLKRKLEIIESLGMDFVYVIPFTEKFSKISAQSFLDQQIIPFFNPSMLVIGYDHHFGNKREGNPDTLKIYCYEKNIKLEIVQKIKDNDHKISSTRIRKFIKNGNIRSANFELGSVFCFDGIVNKGAGRGTVLGFPTANINPIDKNQIIPKKGVYFIRTMIDGQQVFGMCNLGIRPTFNEEDLVIETHFFNLRQINLYGECLRIEFLERIRDEKKFPDAENLKFQLSRDKQICLDLQGKYE